MKANKGEREGEGGERGGGTMNIETKIKFSNLTMTNGQEILA